MISTADYEFFSVLFDHPEVSVRVWPEFALDSGIQKPPIDHSINSIINRSVESPNTIYFPGTSVESSDGFYYNMLPVIMNGEIVLKRVKIQLNYEIYDWESAAQALGLDSEYSLIKEASETLENPSSTEMSRSQAVEIEQILYKGPKGRVQEVVRDQAKSEAIDSVDTMQVGGVTILPVICNELRYLPPFTDVQPDVIAEVAYGFDSWRERYQSLLDEKLVVQDAYIVRTDGAYPSESGVYMLENGNLIKMAADAHSSGMTYTAEEGR
jgi:hypothetical protein